MRTLRSASRLGAARFLALVALLAPAAPHAAILNGSVLGNNVPLANVSVSLMDPLNPTATQFTSTNINGGFSFTAEPATYTVQVSPPSPFVVTSRTIALGAFGHFEFFNLTADSAHVFGRIAFSNSFSASGVQVSLSGPASLTTVTDGGGNYSFPFVPWGTASFGVYSQPGWTPGGVKRAGQVSRFIIDYASRDVAIAGPSVRHDVTIPVHILSGRTVDANGIGVRNVRVAGSGNAFCTLSPCGTYSFATDAEPEDSPTDFFGNFAHWVLEGNYTMSFSPRPGSGFANTAGPIFIDTITGPQLLADSTITFGDSAPPQRLSGPVVKEVTAGRAVVEWLTDEPALGTVLVNGPGFPGTNFAESGVPRTLHSVVVSGLSPASSYFAFVRATDPNGNGSGFSDAAPFTTKPAPDTTPPAFVDGPVVTAISHDGATVEWSTNEPAAALVDFGVTPAFGAAAADPVARVQHRIALPGLAPSTTYRARASATDAEGNGPAQSATLEFKTRPVPDTTAPVILGAPLVSEVSSTGATIRWTTNEPATTGASWNDGLAHGVLSDATLVTEHSARMAGLAGNRTYDVSVVSKDAAGNGPASATLQVVTPPEVDTLPPVFVCAAQALDVRTRTASISWCTGEPADSQVRYGTNAQALTERASRSALGTRHRVTLSGLQPGTTYYYSAESRDASGNVSAPLPVASFQTPVATPPVVEFSGAPVVTYKSGDRITIAWETSLAADAVLECATVAGDTIRVARADRQTRHQLTIGSLAPGVAYTCKVKSVDGEGNAVEQ